MSLNGTAAAALARAVFPWMAAGHPLRGDKFAGFKVLHFLDRHDAAVQDDKTGARVVARTSYPLQVKKADGKIAPLDLTLGGPESDVRPENPTVPIRIDATQHAKVSFLDRGFGFAPASSASSAPIVDRSAAIVPNVARDTDYVVRPDVVGAESGFVLRSAISPEQFTLNFDLPPGAVLRGARSEHPIPNDPPQAIEIDRQGAPIGYLYPPIAYDVDGTAFPTSMTIHGSSVVIEAHHRGRDLHYPLLVDPTAMAFGSYSSGWPGWAWSQLTYGGANFGSANNDPAYGAGLYESLPTNSWFVPNAYAHWYYRAPASTYIYRTQFNSLYHSPLTPTGQSGSWSDAFDGLMNGAYSGWEPSVSYTVNGGSPINNNPFLTTFGFSGFNVDSCFNPRCDASQGSEQNYALEAIQAYNPINGSAFYTGSGKGWTLMQQSIVYLGDRYNPTISSATPADNFAWHHVSPSFSLTASDVGTGLYSVTLRDQTGADVASNVLPATLCTGYENFNPCPGNYSASIGYQPPDGQDTLNLTATDASGRTATQTWHENFDATVPDVTLGGPLSLQDQKQVAENAQELDVTAKDATSGLKSIDVSVDGAKESPSLQIGTAGDTSAHTLQWQFNPERYGAGKHVIRASVADWAGNVSTTQTITVTVNHSATTAIEPGEVNLASGNFKVTRDDIQVAAFRTDLDFSRTFNSRDADARPDGGLGPGWLAGISLEGASSDYIELDDSTATSDGIVEVTDTDGNGLDFAPDGSGGFTPPPDEPGLKLTRLSPSGQYELDDAQGNATIFGLQSGTTTYAPVQVRQAGSGSSATYGYDVRNGVPRVASVIAPAPPGVTCSLGSSPAGSGLVAGCRALTFDYATSTTASGAGTDPSQWGDFNGNLRSITLWAADPTSGSEQSTIVEQYSYDSNGRLRAAWDPRISPALKEVYNYDGNHDISQITPPGEQPWNLTYRRMTIGWTTDATDGRLRTVSRATPAGTATTTIVYGVAVSGTGAPYQMSASDTGKWGQSVFQQPSIATAVFPPDQVPADPPATWTRATVHYLDSAGNEVNVARPGGRISTTEYDNFQHPTRELDAENRARALAYGTTDQDHAARAKQLDVQHVYSADGVRELEELGPLHTVRLSSGADVDARQHTVMTYDQGAPSTGGPYNLVTTTTVGASIPGQSSDSDVRTTTKGYGGVDTSGHANAGWTWHEPTSVTVDPSDQNTHLNGLNLTTTYVLDVATGGIAERRLPANPAGGDAHTRKTIFFTAGANPADAACGNAPALATLTCKTLLAAQPTGGTGLPPIPTRTFAYNRLWLQASATDVAGSHTRTRSTSYDAAGRETGEAVASDDGTSEPSVTYGYDAATGRQTTVTANDTLPRTVTRAYDSDGRLASYTDADGNVATTTYDIDGRTVSTNDGKGSRTFSYDATTGDLSSLVDSGAGTINGSYDADGRLVLQTLPGSLQEQITLDATGARSEIKYTKGGSAWFDETVARNAAGQIVNQSSGVSSRTFGYDPAGRLTSEKRDAGSTNCAIDAYTYDADSNRKTKLSQSCGGTTGTGPTHLYDTADRIVDAGYLYDSWGRITSVPAADAGGGVLASGYFVDDRLRSLVQASRTRTFDLDPLRRVRVTTAVDPKSGNKTVTTVTTHHYADDSDSPAWTAESADGTHWTRNVPGLDGDLALIQDNQSGVTAQVEDVEGEIVAAPTVSASTLGTAKESDAFGIPGSSAPARYAWLGAKRRRTELPTGIVAMGLRGYDPYLGRLLQTDPVDGGSANNYDYVNQDPVDGLDLAGTMPADNWCDSASVCHGVWHTKEDVERYLRSIHGLGWLDPVWRIVQRVHRSRACKYGLTAVEVGSALTGFGGTIAGALKLTESADRIFLTGQLTSLGAGTMRMAICKE